MSIGRVHHIGYLVADIKRSGDSFSALGYIAEGVGFFDNIRQSKISFFIKDDIRVELVEPDKNSDLYPLLKKYKNEIYHICYCVDDLDESINELKGKGFLLFKDRQNAPAISKNAVVVFLMHARMGMIELLEEGCMND